ncbi:alpha-1,2-fucosyltransferase [Microbacterium fluvii]|uniref:Alpha-1,2-fucosyltransferase n=1 Tax=Microbacterium fluvii TaxID=415215 RepID=A0ABW2HAT3_9MICO|nr:alpha-1,2-fucosyltransferase [Microbacterium fluvii]MCU4671197.1 alpha-1,2-fucosyltransferase [Microbacterium fluvii]
MFVELTGGLANQLFQWAAGRVLADEFGADLRLDTRLVDRPDGRGAQVQKLVREQRLRRPSAREASAWEAVHSHLPSKAVGVLKRLRRLTYAVGWSTARTYREARAVLSRGKSVRLSGLFQDVAEVIPHRTALRDRIVLPTTDHLADEPLYAAVHVRRGDYVANEKYAATFGSCSPEYYREGLMLCNPEYPVVLVTDDREWSEQFGRTIVGRDVRVSAAADHFEDFAVLSRASDIVLSNSTFSWWAAFLSEASVVVAPSPWFTDTTRDRGLVLSDWVELARGA